MKLLLVARCPLLLFLFAVDPNDPLLLYFRMQHMSFIDHIYKYLIILLP